MIDPLPGCLHPVSVRCSEPVADSSASKELVATLYSTCYAECFSPPLFCFPPPLLSPSLSFPLMPHLTPTCPALSCPVLSCPVLPCPVLPCPVLPCPALPCPVLSPLLLSSRIIGSVLPYSLPPSLPFRFPFRTWMQQCRGGSRDLS
jgi:hypothetical protein